MADNSKEIIQKQKPPVVRLLTGGFIFILGLICPVFIPLVLITDLSAAAKTIFSGLLALGIPELLMLVAIAILGRPGYEYLKSGIFHFFKKYGPPARVSRTRYRIGLVLFITPILFILLLPYTSDFLPFYKEYGLPFNITLDLVFLASLLVLGGDFWDKLRSLFIYNSKAVIRKKDKSI
ncbi:MAG TPA: hypothetical protein VIN10_09250 [Bacteroidales bacterium]